MGIKKLNIVDDMILSTLLEGVPLRFPEENISAGTWIRVIRTYLRMTQDELARRSNLTKSHLISIEKGRLNPTLKTLQKAFQALSCDLVVWPKPEKPLDEVLRGQARSLALKRLKQSMGTMALEGQAPDESLFKRLLEKKTDEILRDSREKLWRKDG